MRAKTPAKIPVDPTAIWWALAELSVLVASATAEEAAEAAEEIRWVTPATALWVDVVIDMGKKKCV